MIGLDIPGGSLFTPDLRVERVADGIEVHAREAGGWLKKSDKLVTHKLGRYHVASVTIGATVRVQLRADANAGEMTIIAPPNGDLMVDASGGGGAAREIMIEDRDRPGLRAFVDKLEAATRSLGQSRGPLVSIELDNKSLGERGNPRLLAERLTAAMAPTVHKIKQHSRSSDELVLRRLLGDNRREETFVPVAELVEKFAVLPAHARSVFAPLQLQGEPAMAMPVEPPRTIDAPRAKEPSKSPVSEMPVVARTPTPELQSVIAKLNDTKPVEVKQVVPMPERAGSKTAPPSIAIPEAAPRKKEPTQPFGAPPPSLESKSVPVPIPAPGQDLDDEEWPAISRDDQSKPISSS